MKGCKGDPNLFHCNGSTNCIPMKFVCDGNIDCEISESDENPELCARKNYLF